MHANPLHLAIEASYRWIDYRQAYAAVLEGHANPQSCLLELFVFRVWLSQFALHHLQGGRADEEEASHSKSTPPPPRWLLSKQAQEAGIIGDGQADLLATLLQRRFPHYDRAALASRSVEDPLGLLAATSVLISQSSRRPTEAATSCLLRRTLGQYSGIKHAYQLG